MTARKVAKAAAVTIRNADELQAAVAEYFRLSGQYGPMVLAANETVQGIGNWPAPSKARDRAMEAFMRKNGSGAIERRLDVLHDAINAFSDTVTGKAVSFHDVGVADFRERALVLLYESKPIMYDHEGEFDFPDDGGATRALFDAAAAFSGLSGFVASIERDLQADCRNRRRHMVAAMKRAKGGAK